MIKSFLKKSAVLRAVQSRIQFGIPVNYWRKQISGPDNRVRVDSRHIAGTRIFIRGSGNTVTLDDTLLVRNLTVKIWGNRNTVHISRDCQIKAGVVWIEGDDNSCVFGSGSTVESAEFYLTERNTRITLGSDCMLADSIVFRTGDSHSILDAVSGEVLNPAGDILVGDHVWIGQGVTLLKNSRVASGSVVGTRSLVTRDFREEGSVIAGVPAKEIRSGIRWVRERL
jgi:acetyltransferase-like isoleucine patch superfamily enzyme